MNIYLVACEDPIVRVVALGLRGKDEDRCKEAREVLKLLVSSANHGEITHTESDGLAAQAKKAAATQLDSLHNLSGQERAELLRVAGLPELKGTKLSLVFRKAAELSAFLQLRCDGGMTSLPKDPAERAQAIDTVTRTIEDALNGRKQR